MEELKTHIKRVAIYLRKSRNNEGEETEETLLNHRNRLLTIANKNKWKYELFQEVGSSMNENRPEYKRMIHMLQEGIFDAVLSVNLARVTRDDAETPKFMRLLREEDILFITDSERIYNLDVQEDFQALKFTGFINNWEYENIKAQLRKGKIDSAKLGRWSNGVPNYGYVYNKLERKLDIDEEKAKAVKLAFQLVIDGMGIDNISVELNKLGYRTNKGNHFHGNTVKRIIQSEIYKGWIVSNRIKGRNINEGKLRSKEDWIIVKDAHTPIVDEETWDKANKVLNERKSLSPRARQRKHGLSTLIRCAYCNRVHSISNRKDRNNVKVIQACKKKDAYGNTCDNRGFQYIPVFEIILDKVAEHREEIQIQLENFKDDIQIINTKTEKLKQLNTRIETVNNALNTLQIQLEEGLIDIPLFKERKRARNDELIYLQAEYDKLSDTTKEDEINNMEDYIKRLDMFINQYDSLDEEAINKGLMTFIDKILWEYPKGAESPKMDIVWK